MKEFWFLYESHNHGKCQGSYNHEEEFIQIDVSMGNVKTNSNGRRGKKEHVTRRIL
jgi:hypothetical protein